MIIVCISEFHIVSHSFRFEEPPRLHLLIGTHPWPTEDLSDSLCPRALQMYTMLLALACITGTSAMHSSHRRSAIGFIIHIYIYIYTYYQYCPTSMFLLLPVDSHDLSSTSIFWHEMNHEGWNLPSRLAPKCFVTGAPPQCFLTSESFRARSWWNGWDSKLWRVSMCHKWE